MPGSCFVSLRELVEKVRNSGFAPHEAEGIVGQIVTANSARLKSGPTGLPSTWNELSLRRGGNWVAGADLDVFERDLGSTSVSPSLAGPRSLKAVLEDPDMMIEAEPARAFLARNYGIPSVDDARAEPDSEARAAGGRPHKWNWDRLKALAFAHFDKEGFSPSDAARKPAVDQIADYMVHLAIGVPNKDGATLRRSDAKPHAEATYTALQDELEQAPLRKKPKRQ